MFSTQLVEYLKKTHEEKRSLNPNIRKQYDFQIREKVKKASSHFNLLLSSHSDDQLKKIFSDERHALSELIKDFNKRIMPPEYFKAHEELKHEFFHSPKLLQAQIRSLKGGFDEYEGRAQSLKDFINEQGLKEKYISEYLQRLRADQMERLKKHGLPDEEIADMLNQDWENKMSDSIWGDKKAKGGEKNEEQVGRGTDNPSAN